MKLKLEIAEEIKDSTRILHGIQKERIVLENRLRAIDHKHNMKKVIGFYILLILFIPSIIFSEDFDFYGVRCRFGDTKDEIRNIF